MLLFLHDTGSALPGLLDGSLQSPYGYGVFFQYTEIYAKAMAQAREKGWDPELGEDE